MPQAWTGIATKQQAAFILSHVNLVPFSYLGFFNRYVIFQEVGRNILLTIPFGFGISFIARVRPKDLLWLSLGAGLAIEGTQLAVSLGLGGLYRTVDVTDVLVNAIGVWLGYGCFMFFSHLYLSRTRQLGIEPRGVLAYVHEVAARAQPGGAKSG
jgi:glycopeptide antibiotics resistance protein